MTSKLIPLELPVTQGSKDHGFNANVLYDGNGDGIATLIGLPQNTDLTVLARMVERHDCNGMWNEGAARAAYIVKALNSFPLLLLAVQQAGEALASAVPTHAHYPEPLARHDAAQLAVAAALAAASGEVPADKRWGWDAAAGTLLTSAGPVKLEPTVDMSDAEKDTFARHIAACVTLVHQLGGAGL